jgi:heterodisulfide reductase subunit C
MIFMVDTKDFTVEELKKMHEDLIQESNTIGEMLKKKMQEEEERKEAQLALEKESRKKEVDDAWEKYHKLLKAYIEDYGSYAQTTDTDWFPNSFWKSFF